MNVEGLRQVPGDAAWNTGAPKVAQKEIRESEQARLRDSVVSTKTGPLFMRPGEIYVFVIDPDRGLTYAAERKDLKLPTVSGGVTHPMIRPGNEKVAIGGEMMMGRDGTLYFNTRSGRYSASKDAQEMLARRQAVETALRNLRKDDDRLPLDVRFAFDLEPQG